MAIDQAIARFFGTFIYITPLIKGRLYWKLTDISLLRQRQIPDTDPQIVNQLVWMELPRLIFTVFSN